MIESWWNNFAIGTLFGFLSCFIIVISTKWSKKIKPSSGASVFDRNTKEANSQ